MGCLAASVTAGSGWASLLEVVADFTRLSAVRAAVTQIADERQGSTIPGVKIGRRSRHGDPASVLCSGRFRPRHPS